MKDCRLVILLVFVCCSSAVAQKTSIKDSTVVRVTYRDTVIYRYDTIRIKHYVHSDTVWTTPKLPTIEPAPKKKGVINPNNWGIGPMFGAYYSPINGFDVNIGFGVQYYLLAIPSFRNPHMGHRRNRK